MIAFGGLLSLIGRLWRERRHKPAGDELEPETVTA
jgi:hypothetical protein